MRIGVTGSAGFLGANLVRALHRQRSKAEDILCFYSRRRSNPLTDHLDLTYRHLDITSREEGMIKHSTYFTDIVLDSLMGGENFA